MEKLLLWDQVTIRIKNDVFPIGKELIEKWALKIRAITKNF